MAVPKPDPPGMTWAEYSLLPDDGKRYEVLEGVLTVAPAPNFRHQDIIWQLGPMLRAFVSAHNLGIVVGAPIHVILALDTIVQPDILFIAKENVGMIDDRIHGAPDLCIEVLSPSTALNDRYAKKEIYARFGVHEYWIIDGARQSVTIYTMQGRAYGEPTEAMGNDLIRATVVEGFAIRAGDIFVI
jgi:Uma2 family endonuclease